LYNLHWRGVALANFDGKSWSNPREQIVIPREPDGSFLVPYFSQGIPPAVVAKYETGLGKQNHLIHYRVLMEPIGTNVFFLAPWARRVTGAYGTLQIDEGGGVSDLDSQRSVSLYEADSDIALPSPEQLRAASASLPPLASIYLQLPAKLDPRVPQLAEQIAASARTNYDKAAALERYLRTHYGYTLQLPRTPVDDPLANFLFERKAGHCEYFASSMAVMLRTLGIPSRAVTGFVSEEFNDVTGNYVVRARNAHAWVEAYFPGYGWITFDPTPGGGTSSPQGWGRAMLYLDAAESFWREWIVSYDASHQSILGHAMLNGTRNSFERVRLWTRMRYSRLLNLARKGQRGVERSPERWYGTSVVLAVALLALANAGRIARMIRIRRLRVHPERTPNEAAAMWYERMSRFLARRGMKKSAAQTPQEFVRVIGDQELRQRVRRFTEAYESARFGNSPEDAQQLPELYEEVEAAGRK
jgi:transglutaminase-like putative cysteine protease